MSILIPVAIFLLVATANILILRFMNPANKNKIICPIEDCMQAFEDPDEYLDHLRTVHSHYFDYKG